MLNTRYIRTIRWQVGLSVDYIGLIPVIVESIKEQQQQIEELQALVSQLTDKNILRSSAQTKEATGIISINTEKAILYQNAPNPFSHETHIQFYIPDNINTASLNIYNMEGKQLMQIPITQRGESSHLISGHHFSAGIYLYALIADGIIVDTKRMVLTK